MFVPSKHFITSKRTTMTTAERSAITVKTTVKAPVEKVWELWTGPEHITRWNQASDEWHSPQAQNDLRPGGAFSYRMEAKDGSFGFDFGGVYDTVQPHQLIQYTLGDGRKVSVAFQAAGSETTIEETFEPEQTNPEELQRTGWQAILESFRKYAESVS